MSTAECDDTECFPEYLLCLPVWLFGTTISNFPFEDIGQPVVRTGSFGAQTNPYQ